jgi:hypothetical protein
MPLDSNTVAGAAPDLLLVRATYRLPDASVRTQLPVGRGKVGKEGERVKS